MPVLRPRGVAALPALALAAAVASIVTAAFWHGTAWLAGAALTALLLAAGLLHSIRFSPSPVSALRTAAGAGRWQVRLPGGWREAGGGGPPPRPPRPLAEEGGLAVDNGLGHSQDGVEAL
ncbi:hypothetical protein O9556_25745, partial [Achromobacter xylosoxidans]|nr:hypothetical protein [Achromobacter xylosoxidans]